MLVAPRTKPSESELAAHTGTRYAVGVSNGLDALALIFKAIYRAGTPPRRRCRDSSANTYIASVLAVTDAGLRPIFAEPCSATLNLDTSRPRRGIYPDVKAVLTVHLYGRACYDTVLDDFAHRHELIVVGRQRTGHRSGSLRVRPHWKSGPRGGFQLLSY